MLSKSVILKFLKKWIPWVVCFYLFHSLFKQVDPQAVYQAFTLANPWSFLLYSLSYFLLVWILDCFALKHFISRFSTPVTLREIFFVRGATYLLMIINYPLSQGALAVYLNKTHHANIAKSLGTVGFVMMADLLLILTSGLAALSFTHVEFGGVDLNRAAFKLVPLLYVGFFFWVWVWKKTDQGILKKWRRFKIINWLLSHDVFLIFREANFRDYLVLFAWRLPLLVIVLAGYNFALFSFHARLDWTTIFLFNPIIMLASTLPITPAGLGTGQYLTMLFFQNSLHSPLIVSKILNSEQILLASSLIWSIINQVYKFIFGALCLFFIPKESLKK